MKGSQNNIGRNLNILNEPHSQIEHLRKMYNIDVSNEFSLIKREFEESGMFSFTSGKGKITSHADVAYIFKQLENKAIENAFAVLVKNGEPTVIHLGMGTASSSLVDTVAIIQADNRLQPDQIYLVHNHPSGNLKASVSDVLLYDKLKQLFGNKLQCGIIINLTSGKFGVYDEDNLFLTAGNHNVLEKKEKELDVKVYSFSRQIFAEDYNPETAQKATTPYEVAQIVSSQRLGERNKMGFLVTQSSGHIVGNIFLPYTELTKINLPRIAEEMVLKATAMSGVNVIPYGNFTGTNLCSTLAATIKKKSADGVRMRDAVYIDKTKGVYASWEENGGFYDNIPSDDMFNDLPSVREPAMQYSFNFDATLPQSELEIKQEVKQVSSVTEPVSEVTQIQSNDTIPEFDNINDLFNQPWKRDYESEARGERVTADSAKYKGIHITSIDTTPFNVYKPLSNRLEVALYGTEHTQFPAYNAFIRETSAPYEIGGNRLSYVRFKEGEPLETVVKFIDDYQNKTLVGLFSQEEVESLSAVTTATQEKIAELKQQVEALKADRHEKFNIYFAEKEKMEESGETLSQQQEAELTELQNAHQEVKYRQDRVEAQIFKIEQEQIRLQTPKESVLKTLLEGELPSKLPSKKDLLWLDENDPIFIHYNGIINVRPIKAKTVPKSAKEALLEVASTPERESLRPTITGIRHDAENGVDVTTDAHCLLVIPANNSKSWIEGRDGSEMEGNFPNWKDVVTRTEAAKHANIVLRATEVESVMDQLTGAVRASRFIQNNGLGVITEVDDVTMAFHAETMLKVLRGLKATGSQNLAFEFNDKLMPLIIRDQQTPEKLGLVMPQVLGDKGFYGRSGIIHTPISELYKIKQAQVQTQEVSNDVSAEELVQQIENKPTEKAKLEKQLEKLQESYTKENLRTIAVNNNIGWGAGMRRTKVTPSFRRLDEIGEKINNVKLKIDKIEKQNSQQPSDLPLPKIGEKYNLLITAEMKYVNNATVEEYQVTSIFENKIVDVVDTKGEEWAFSIEDFNEYIKNAENFQKQKNVDNRDFLSWTDKSHGVSYKDLKDKQYRIYVYQTGAGAVEKRFSVVGEREGHNVICLHEEDFATITEAKKYIDENEVELKQKLIGHYPELGRNDKIDDFGEKIGGAKKDLARTYIDTLSSVTQTDIANKPLSEVFPRPNYNLLIEEGKISQSQAITMNYLYDNLGKKPQGRRYKYGINSWSEKVIALSNDFKAMIEHGAMLDPNIFTTLGIHNHEVPNSNYRAYCGLMDGLDFPRVDVRLNNYKPIIYTDGRYALVNDYLQVASGKDISEFVEEAKKISGIFPEKKAALLKTHRERAQEKPIKIDVWHYRHSSERFIAAGTKGNLTTLVEGFKNSEEAHTFLRENREELEQKFRNIKEIPFERREINDDRNGEDYRKGKAITPQMFADTFGFRGVEFGNWVNQAERQMSLNEAYDALLDLAQVMGIEPKAISLGGELALAFGARGSGKANAHYEPLKVVINLTKTRGSGSLAHEWWHAVDNYFAKKVGNASYMSDSKPSSENAGIRKEVSDAWKELNKKINDKIFTTNYAERSERIDKFKSKKYWGTPREMSARAFEAHVVEELAKKGIKNDYLANIRELHQWKNEDVLDKNSTYPYPTKAEREMFAPKFQNLFDSFQQIQNIETGQMMLNEPEMEYNTMKKENAEVVAINDYFTKGQDPKYFKPHFLAQVIKAYDLNPNWQPTRDFVSSILEKHRSSDDITECNKILSEYAKTFENYVTRVIEYEDYGKTIVSSEVLKGIVESDIFKQFESLKSGVRYIYGAKYKYESTEWENKHKQWYDLLNESEKIDLYYGNATVDEPEMEYHVVKKENTPNVEVYKALKDLNNYLLKFGEENYIRMDRVKAKKLTEKVLKVGNGILTEVERAGLGGSANPNVNTMTGGLLANHNWSRILDRVGGYLSKYRVPEDMTVLKEEEKKQQVVQFYYQGDYSIEELMKKLSVSPSQLHEMKAALEHQLITNDYSKINELTDFKDQKYATIVQDPRSKQFSFVTHKTLEIAKSNLEHFAKLNPDYTMKIVPNPKINWYTPEGNGERLWNNPNGWVYLPQKTLTIKDIPQGDYFKLRADSNTVYVRNHYAREIGKYSISRYDDINAERFVKGDTKVFPPDTLSASEKKELAIETNSAIKSIMEEFENRKHELVLEEPEMEYKTKKRVEFSEEIIAKFRNEFGDDADAAMKFFEKKISKSLKQGETAKIKDFHETTIFEKIERLNDRERAVYTEVLELAKNGDTVKEFNFDELKVDGFSQTELKGYISQLTQKGLIEKLEGSYYDFQVATTGMDVLQEPIMQYNQTSTADMDKKIQFLSEKIGDSWFKNAEIDYGIIGGVEKLSYEKEADVLLVVTKEENGFDPLQTVAITHASDYNAEQLYDIWMEQYSSLGMMMVREPEMPYQNKQMTCFESSEKIWQFNDLNISQSELNNTALEAAENWWYDKSVGNRPMSAMSEFESSFGIDDDPHQNEGLFMEYLSLYAGHRNNPEVYSKYIDDLNGINDIWLAVYKNEPVSEEMKKEAVSDVMDFLKLDQEEASEIVEERITEFSETREKQKERCLESILAVHNAKDPSSEQIMDAVWELGSYHDISRDRAEQQLERELQHLKVNDVVDEVWKCMQKSTNKPHEYVEACRDIAKIYDISFSEATMYLIESIESRQKEQQAENMPIVGRQDKLAIEEQTELRERAMMEQKPIEEFALQLNEPVLEYTSQSDTPFKPIMFMVDNYVVEVGRNELSREQKIELFVNKKIEIKDIVRNDRKCTAIVTMNKDGEIKKEYRYLKKKQDLRIKSKIGVATGRKGIGV
jgi:transposase-like protein